MNADCALFQFLGISLLILLSGCLPPPEDGEQEQRRQVEQEAFGPELTVPSEDVQTIQLYRGDDERSMPVLPLRSGERLTLSFDKLQSTGRPLSAYFYQKNARWERTLSPSEYMESFASDNLLDYQRSQGTDVDYIHYRYSFPNDQINFRIGGNYVLRITEQGSESAVLFEVPFYVVEQRGNAAIEVESAMIGGRQRPARRPIVQFRPHDDQFGNMQNYHACVLRDGRTDDMRCTRRARMANHPNMRFEIDREHAFPPLRPAYQLDLSRIQAGGHIDAVDRQARPPNVRLRPDYPQFDRNVLRQPLLGHSMVGNAMPFLNTPYIQAEYVRVQFALESVSPEQGVSLMGSFLPPGAGGLDLTWSSERDRFEVETLVKQGWHEYRYDLARPPGAQDPSAERDRVGHHRYTALIYYRDIQLNADRIVAAESVVR